MHAPRTARTRDFRKKWATAVGVYRTMRLRSGMDASCDHRSTKPTPRFARWCSSCITDEQRVNDLESLCHPRAPQLRHQIDHRRAGDVDHRLVDRPGEREGRFVDVRHGCAVVVAAAETLAGEGEAVGRGA